MKRILILVLIIPTIFSCKKKNDESFSHKLKNCKIEYLFFYDEIKITTGQTLTFPPSDSMSLSYYNYENERMTRITGGFAPVPHGPNLSYYIFSHTAYDSLLVNGNAIFSYIKYVDGEGKVHDNTMNPIIYYLNTQNRLTKINKKNSFYPDGFDLKYTYFENQMTETRDTFTNRKFYFEGNNLVKVTTERYDTLGNLTWKKEILFQDYDNNPNPFQDMYFVSGAFFRAFSKNNYESYRINEYSLLADSTLGIYYSYHFTMPITYNSDGYPNFGEYY